MSNKSRCGGAGLVPTNTIKTEADKYKEFLNYILKRLGKYQVGDDMSWVGRNYSKAELRDNILEVLKR